MDVGERVWAIAEGYLPPLGPNPEDRALRSHEAACILNANAADAHIEITIFFQDREPLGPYRVTVAARRTHHLRFDDLMDPAPIPRETDYASLLVSDQPVVVQHTRLDARPRAFKVMTSTAFSQAASD